MSKTLVLAVEGLKSESTEPELVRIALICDDPMGWPELIEGAQSGNREDFRELLEQIGALISLLFERVLPKDQAKRAVCATLGRVARKLHTHQPGHPVLPWVIAVAAYCSRTFLDTASTAKG